MIFEFLFNLILEIGGSWVSNFILQMKNLGLKEA